MSEPQAEYDSDAEPTPGPWTVKQGTIVSESGRGKIKHIASLLASHPAALDESDANARLIAAAGTAAHNLPDEYDPVDVVEALPTGLERVRRAIIDLLDGPPGNTNAPAVASAVKRLTSFLGDAGNASEIVDDKFLDDALDAARNE